MKIFVATTATRLIPGELVYPGMQCDRPEHCGCGRYFVGASSHQGTYTATIAELPVTRAEYLRALREPLEDLVEDEADLEAYVDELLRMADVFEVGDTIERNGTTILART